MVEICSAFFRPLGVQEFVCNSSCEGTSQNMLQVWTQREVLQSHPMPNSPPLHKPENHEPHEASLKTRLEFTFPPWTQRSNITIAITNDVGSDRAKSPEFRQREGALGSKIAAQNHKLRAIFHRTLYITMKHCRNR